MTNCDSVRWLWLFQAVVGILGQHGEAADLGHGFVGVVVDGGESGGELAGRGLDGFKCDGRISHVIDLLEDGKARMLGVVGAFDA